MSEQPGIAPAGEPEDFEGCLARVNPSRASLQNLSQQADNSPVLMFNLLRFRPRGDAGIYSMYGRQAAPEIEKVGSFIAYYGAVITDLNPDLGFDTSYDALILPVYHRRRSYLELQQSSRYQLAIPYRCAGTSRRTLYVLGDDETLFNTSQNIASMDSERRPVPARAGEVYVTDMLRFAGAQGKEDCYSWGQRVLPLLQQAGASPVLSLKAETPVLSEQYWNHCTLTRFPSMQAMTSLYQSSDWQRALCSRQSALENSITVATKSLDLLS